MEHVMCRSVKVGKQNIKVIGLGKKKIIER